MNPPKLPYDLEIKYVYYASDNLIVVVSWTDSVFYEFIWKPHCETYEKINLFRKYL